MIRLFDTDPAGARALHLKLLPIFETLFIEPSPAPLKAALGWLGLPGGPLRLPMVPIDVDSATRLADAMTAVGLHPSFEDS